MALAPSDVDLRFTEAELDTRRDRIVAFIRERVAAAGADLAVLGLSGGIDSTLTAHLAVEALGTDGVYGLVLPSSATDAANTDDAQRVADDLGIDADVIGIEPIADAFLDELPGVDRDDGAIQTDPLRTAVGNLRARSRAVIAYFVANREHAIVLGTGNRSEAAVGYFTKYGDGAVDCHPIGDLYKVQVRQLARHLGVDDAIVAKPPTAGLWAGQTDEAELGMGYDVLDAILALSVDGPLSPGATARLLDGVDAETVDRVHALHARSEHKRRVPPTPDGVA